MYAIYLQATFLNDIATAHPPPHTHVQQRVIEIELEQDMTWYSSKVVR